ncbi:unnamed protein product [Pylaiella littoralis]
MERIPAPSPTGLKDVQGFKALMRETAKVGAATAENGGGGGDGGSSSSSSSSSGRDTPRSTSGREAGAGDGDASRALLLVEREKRRRREQKEEAVRVGWYNVGLSDMEAGDEVSLSYHTIHTRHLAKSVLVSPPMYHNSSNDTTGRFVTQRRERTTVAAITASGATSQDEDSCGTVTVGNSGGGGNSGNSGEDEDSAAAVARNRAPLLSHDSFCPAPSTSSSSLLALSSALRRVSRLRELLSSVGEAEAWAVLLSGDDGRLGCRRLADLALAAGSRSLALAPEAAVAAAATAAAAAAAVGSADGDEERYRRLCSAALTCLAMCGRISPGAVWADLSRSLGDETDDSDGRSCGGGSGSGNGNGSGRSGETRLTRLLSLCVSLAENTTMPGGGAKTTTGLNEHEYFFGKGSSGWGQGGGEDPEGEEPGLSVVGLTVAYEIITGSCKGRVEGLRRWDGIGGAVGSLMDLIALGDDESSYIGATKCLLAANDPFLRRRSPPPLGAEVEAEAEAEAAGGAAMKTKTASVVVSGGGDSCRPSSRSAVVPALLQHSARHEVDGAVLHIFNEAGYPNGDTELARLCLTFCYDAFEEDRDGDLFYVNDIKVLVDVVVRELCNLPADDPLRVDYLRLLTRLLEQSEWATRGGRYRELDIRRASGLVTTTS